MKLPYSTTLTDMAGIAIQTQAATDSTPAKFLTLKDALLAAFSANHSSDERLSQTERYALGKLGFQIGKEADLSVEDAAKAKDRAGLVLTPGLVFQVADLIEAAAAPVADVQA
jgi:hypothetical protein